MHARNNRTTGLCKPFLNNGSVNTFPRHKDYYRKGSVEKKSLVVGLKGLDAKANWLEVNRQS
jgi:hypothetical protein